MKFRRIRQSRSGKAKQKNTNAVSKVCLVEELNYHLFFDSITYAVGTTKLVATKSKTIDAIIFRALIKLLHHIGIFVYLNK